MKEKYQQYIDSKWLDLVCTYSKLQHKKYSELTFM